MANSWPTRAKCDHCRPRHGLYVIDSAFISWRRSEGRPIGESKMAALRDHLGHRVSPCLLHGAVAIGDACPMMQSPLPSRATGRFIQGETMRPSDYGRLLALAAIWGASFCSCASRRRRSARSTPPSCGSSSPSSGSPPCSCCCAPHAVSGQAQIHHGAWHHQLRRPLPDVCRGGPLAARPQGIPPSSTPPRP